jgi:hypothetical protein
MYTITHVFVLNHIVTVLENYCVVIFFCQKLEGPWPTLDNNELRLWFHTSTYFLFLLFPDDNSAYRVRFGG